MKSDILLSNPGTVDELLKKQTVLRQWSARPGSGKAFAVTSGVSRATIYRYLKRQRGGLLSLVDGRKTAARERTAVLGCHLQWLKGYIAAFPRVPLTVACDELNQVAARENWPKVKYTSLLKAFNSIPADERSVLRDDEDAFFQQHFPIGRRSVPIPLQMVQIDATEVDVWCIDMVTGEVFRPWMSGVIDCASRNVLAAHVHRKEPNAIDVLRLLKEAILPKRNRLRPWFGIFIAANTDNAWIYKDTNVAAAMLKLGVDWQHSPKACSAANGKIERLFGTFTTRLFRKLPGYSGRPNAKARVQHQGGIPFPFMQGIVDRFVDSEYSVRKHSELGISPWEAWHESLDSIPNLIFDVQATSDAFRYAETAEVHRGAIIISGRAYKAPELAALTGKKVEAWLDPDSVKKRLDITYQGKHLGQAVRDDGDLAEELNAQRTARTVSLRKVRKAAKAILTTTPPHDVVPIHKPKHPRKAKASVASQIVPAPSLAVEE